MNKNNRGFSAVEFIMIVVVLAIVGVFVFFASKNKKVDVPIQNTQKEQTSVTKSVNNVTEQKTVTTPEVTFAPLENDEVISWVKQLSTDAESRYNGSYKKVFASANIIKDNGAGIMLEPGSVGAKVAEEAKSKGSMIFVITNEKVTTYAIYAKFSGTPTMYYCLASDGSKKAVSKPIGISGLSSKPICK